MLNIDQKPEELNDLYSDRDYYWYLRSPEFHDAFLSPLGEMVNLLGCPCLDIPCGEGQLSEHVDVPYLGVDGSVNAIKKAKKDHPYAKFEIGRVEDYFKSRDPYYETVVFGGLFSVLIKPDNYIDLVECYKPRCIVIYDLITLDCLQFDKKYDLIYEYVGTAKVKTLDPEIKKHRKIRAYRCRP